MMQSTCDRIPAAGMGGNVIVGPWPAKPRRDLPRLTPLPAPPARRHRDLTVPVAALAVGMAIATLIVLA